MLFLPTVPDRQWRSPSQAMPKDEFGKDTIVTRFHISARLNDGHLVWRGWFDDRYDADAFLYAIATDTLHLQPALWTLPQPMWVPGMGEQLAYYFATTTYISNTATTSYTMPVDWSPSNSIQCFAGGGGGGAGRTYNNGGAGGGGGAYAKIENTIAVTPNSSVTIRIGAGGAQGNASGGAGGVGGDTYFNGSSSTSCTVGAQGGRGGNSGVGAGTTAGGQASSSTGTTKYSGGNGGNESYGGGGGGGAAGPSGAGNSGSGASAGQGGTGGSGDAGAGGAGGAGGGPGTNGTAGSAGTELGSGYGCGGGGGGGGGDGPGAGALGGLYGAGGGAGGQSTGGSLSGAAGRQGFMLITYEPSAGGLLMLFGR